MRLKLVEHAAQKSPYADAFELCKTRSGRAVPALRVRQPGVKNEQRVGIWIQARQHAWESGSSWVCKGFVNWLVSSSPQAIALRKKASITIVPIMDIDNVAIGAGGKEQKPQDHNRDWSNNPYWPSVKSAMKQIKKMDKKGQFDLFIDLHNPDAGSKNASFYITPRRLISETGRRNLDHFLSCAGIEMTGPPAFKGKTVESGATYDERWKLIAKNWVSMNTKQHVVSLTLETAWDTPHSTTAGYQTVGRQLGLAIERYFRVFPRLED